MLVVRPISRTEARKLCESHPHAGTLPNSSKYYMRADIDGRCAGLAVWGWGIMPKATPDKLFAPGTIGVSNYLELCRFFVYDWCPKNTASRFLATTHRLIKRYAPDVDLLFTYAAGFQGLVGYIYQATGYDYIGTQEVNSFLWIEGRGLVHRIALHHRYGKGTTRAAHWQDVFPGSKQWCGENFKYIYWVCSKTRKRELLERARFRVVAPYPKDADLKIWTIDAAGRRDVVPVGLAKQVPIVKLKSSRAPEA